MKAFSIKELAQGGASRVVREAENGPVIISRNNEPAALVLSFNELSRTAAQTGNADVYQNALALLAVKLFDDGALSLGRAAELGGMSLADFIDLNAALHVPILREPEHDVAAEVDAFEEWLSSVRRDRPAESRTAQ
jgi:predicted HTH domain antitoxin